MYACLVSKTSISEGASVSAPLSAIETPLASPFSISDRVLTRQKTGPPAEAETIQNEIGIMKKKTRKVLRMSFSNCLSSLLCGQAEIKCKMKLYHASNFQTRSETGQGPCQGLTTLTVRERCPEITNSA